MRPDEAPGPAQPSLTKTPMRVLLTGANGFVGSHILEHLQNKKIDSVLWLRQGCRIHLIQRFLSGVDVHWGTLNDSPGLDRALDKVTHVIHCAGCTKTMRVSDFFVVNHQGTRVLVDAVNRRRGAIQRLLYISSLAASHPAPPQAPAREDDPPHPLTLYGMSKLAGEKEVRGGCQTDFVILRPGAVYGPGDGDFLKLFKAIGAHIAPRFGSGQQALSMVFVGDVADAVLACLNHPTAAGKTYHLAFPQFVTMRELAREVAGQMHSWVIPLPVPASLLWPICLVQEALGRLSGNPSILNRQKIPELRAPGWVCDSSRIKQDLNFEASTSLRDGIGQTLSWYRQKGWL